MEVKPFFKKYWDFTIIIIAFLVFFIIGNSPYLDSLLRLSKLIWFMKIALWGGLIGLAYNAYKTKDKRALRVISLVLLVIFMFIAKGVLVLLKMGGLEL